MQHMPYELVKAMHEERLSKARRERVASMVREINRPRPSSKGRGSVEAGMRRRNQDAPRPCVPCPHPSA
jgi:hypothetical protein